jgi:hypothetical protein
MDQLAVDVVTHDFKMAASMEVIWTKENKEKIIEMLGGTTIPIQY